MAYQAEMEVMLPKVKKNNQVQSYEHLAILYF